MASSPPISPVPDPARVRRVQSILNAHGTRPPLAVDGILGRKTIAAAAIYSKSWQRGPGLIDLVIRRHAADSNATDVPPETPVPAAARLPAILVSLATSQLGKHESGGPNQGPDLTPYFAADSYQPNAADDSYPWCAAFLCWLVQQAMLLAKIPETETFKRPTTPSAFGFEAWSLAQDGSTRTQHAPGKDIQAGDIVILLHSHIVLATGPVDPATGRFPQISGNTNLAGSREGTHVLRHDTHFTAARARIRFTV